MAEGQKLHLDHEDDGAGYRGWAHASCNTRAGAVRGNKLRAQAYRRATGRADLPPEPVCRHHGADCDGNAEVHNRWSQVWY